MKIKTTRFGTLEIGDENILQFPAGLFGFEDVDCYVLIDRREDSPFKWLQAVREPDLAFVVIDPLIICPEYEVRLTEEDQWFIQCESADLLAVLVVVGIPEDPSGMTANLKGPILINPEKRVGRQTILSGAEYSSRFRIVEAILARGHHVEMGGRDSCS